MSPIIVHHNKVRYIVRDTAVDVNERIELDNITVKKIVENLF